MTDKRTNGRTNICDCRDAFATEKLNQVLLKLCKQKQTIPKQSLDPADQKQYQSKLGFLNPKLHNCNSLYSHVGPYSN